MSYDSVLCGQQIRKLRRQTGLTQEQLAENLNISRQYLSRLECGTQSGTIELLYEISEFYGVSLDHLIKGRTKSQERAKEKLEEAAKVLLEFAAELNET